MSVRMIQDRLDSYRCTSTLEEEQALREITQEIALAALSRGEFFQRASFQGGTCLRICHSLDRFSEDLDFVLREPDASFPLTVYLNGLTRELHAFGYELEIDDRSSADRTIGKAFVKDDSLGKLLRLSYKPTAGPPRKLRIKLEVDTRPPAGAVFGSRYLDFPFPSAVSVLDLPSLFAGKLHALLCRDYDKGQDWYDFIWYTTRKTPINHKLLSAALNQAGPWKGQQPVSDRAWCLARLRAKIESSNWAYIRSDLRRFIKAREVPSLELWSKDFFLAQADKL